MGQIISLERIKREAYEAARQGIDPEDWCPYPLDTDAGGAYVGFFERAMQEIQAASKKVAA